VVLIGWVGDGLVGGQTTILGLCPPEGESAWWGVCKGDCQLFWINCSCPEELLKKKALSQTSATLAAFSDLEDPDDALSFAKVWMTVHTMKKASEGEALVSSNKVTKRKGGT
jgi:hypothetical protein